MAYAQVSDLESRWRYLSPEERERAEVLLEDAAAVIGKYDNGDADLRVFTIVSCNMVRRAMEASGDAFGLAQEPQGIGWASSNPTGEISEPFPREVKMLKGGSTKIGYR